MVTKVKSNMITHKKSDNSITGLSELLNTLILDKVTFPSTEDFTDGITTLGTLSDADVLALQTAGTPIETVGFYPGSTTGSAKYKLLNEADSTAQGYVTGYSRFQIRGLDVYACLVVGSVIHTSSVGDTVSISDDNTNAIQHALNLADTSNSYVSSETGLVVHLGRGDTKITNITVPSGVSLKGYGSGISRILAKGVSGWAIQTTAFVGNNRSLETSMEGFQLNGDSTFRVISGGSTTAACNGIGIYSSLGCKVSDIRVYYVGGSNGWGIGFYTSQDCGIDNVDVLHCTNNIDIGFYDNDVSNALHFTKVRSENATGANPANGKILNISGNPNQARQIEFSACKLEGKLITIDSVNGITFAGGTSFVSKVTGDHMIKIAASATSDTRNIAFVGCFFTSSLNKTTKMISATTGTNPVVVVGCTISTLDVNAFEGDIIFQSNSLYDVNAPYANLSAKGLANNNKALAVTRPTASASESSGVYSDVTYSANISDPQLFDWTNGSVVSASSITHGVIYKNHTSEEMTITARVRNNLATGAAGAIQLQVGSTSGLGRSLSTMNMPSHHIEDRSITFRVKAGWYFRLVASSPAATSISGAVIS